MSKTAKIWITAWAVPIYIYIYIYSVGTAAWPYPLARNQYINNSPGIFSCIRAGANTGAACIRTEWIPLRIWQNTREIPPQKYFPVFARVRIQAPHVFAQILIPQEFFPACIGFVPGGTFAKSVSTSLAQFTHFLWCFFLKMCLKMLGFKRCSRFYNFWGTMGTLPFTQASQILGCYTQILLKNA